MDRAICSLGFGGSNRHKGDGTIPLVVDMVHAGTALAVHDLHVERGGFTCRDVLRFAGWTSKGGWIDGYHERWAAEDYDTSGSQHRGDGVSTGGNGCGCDSYLRCRWCQTHATAAIAAMASSDEAASPRWNHELR